MDALAGDLPVNLQNGFRHARPRQARRPILQNGFLQNGFCEIGGLRIRIGVSELPPMPRGIDAIRAYGLLAFHIIRLSKIKTTKQK